MTKLTLGPYDSHAPIIKYVGVFNYDKLYRDMAGWFGKWGYELRENTHKHKVPLPSGSEQDIKWEGWRKVNEYVRFWIDVHLHVYDLKNVEVVKDGVKRKLWWGRVMVRLDFRIDLDYSDRFKGKMGKIMQDILHKYIWRKQIESGWEDEVYYRMYKLHEVIKESLNMESCYNASERRY